MKSVSPTNVTPIRDRAERIASLGYDYAAQPKQVVSTCNLCGMSEFAILSELDRYGFQARAAACRYCGLVCLSPMMTAEAYGRFYIDVYRPLVSAYHGRLIDARTIQEEQREYAIERGDVLASFVEGRGFSTLLDIGGSTGVVAHAVATRFGLHATVLDPSPLEIEEAKHLELETVTGIVEDYDPDGRQFDVVILCQTVDHLLDIAGTFRAIRQLIRSDGLFYVDVVDFRAAYLRNGSIEEAIKIDHPYSLMEPTIEAYLSRTGFTVARSNRAADRLHVGYVCRPSAENPTVLPATAAVERLFNEVGAAGGVVRCR